MATSLVSEITSTRPVGVISDGEFCTPIIAISQAQKHVIEYDLNQMHLKKTFILIKK